MRFDAEACHTERVAEEADVAVCGAASDLYKWAWNRPTIGMVSIEGDQGVAQLWQETVHVRWS